MKPRPGILAVTLALLLVAAFQPAARASVDPWAEAAAQIYRCDHEVSAHPSKVVMKQMITTDMLADVDDIELIMQYSFDAVTTSATIPAGAMVRARAKLFKADGTRMYLGLMQARVGPLGNASAVQQVIGVSLEEGDTVRWRFTFRNFPPMNPRDSLLLIGATSKPGLE